MSNRRVAAPRGALTATAPPLTGSPALDAGGAPTTLFADQRSLPRTPAALVDLGAADARLYWLSDWDGDGHRFGLEHALGTDALRSDANNVRNLTPPIFDTQARAQVTFGVNAAFIPGTQWSVTRSTTLQPGSFTEIYRFNGTAHTFNNTQIAILDNGTAITVIDRFPPFPRAFYRLEALAP